VTPAGLSASQYAQLLNGLACATAIPVGGPGAKAKKVAPPSPAVLAQVAYGELDLPSPTVERSPDQGNADPAFGGQSYTWVNLWTWYWTDPGTWRPLGKTVSAGGVSATVTARPVSLAFDPGDGGSAVSCAGPGRAWTDADGNATPSGGGCGYEYRQVTSGSTPLTAMVSIVWSVSWTSNVGLAGVLPQMVTQASSSFLVEQIHDVNS